MDISHGTISRSIDADFTTSGNAKRRRYASQLHHTVFHLQYHHRRNVDVNFQNNLALTEVSSTSDHVNSSFICSDLISDLKVRNSKTSLQFADIININIQFD